MALNVKAIKKIYFETTPILLLTIVVEVIVGYLLGTLERFVAFLPGLLLIVPGLMEMRGNISTSLGQRLGTGIHLGLADWRHPFTKFIRNQLIATYSLNFLVSFSLATISFSFSLIVGLSTISYFGILFIAISTGMISGFIQSFISLFVSLYSHYRGLDPDNVTVPFLAAVGDLLTILILIGVIDLYLVLSRIFPFLI